MNNFESSDPLPDGWQGLDQDCTLRIDPNGVSNSTFCGRNPSETPSQGRFYGFPPRPETWSTGVQDISSVSEAFPQLLNHSSSVNLTRPIGNIGSITQAPVDGFLCDRVASTSSYSGLSNGALIPTLQAESEGIGEGQNDPFQLNDHDSGPAFPRNQFSGSLNPYSQVYLADNGATFNLTEQPEFRTSGENRRHCRPSRRTQKGKGINKPKHTRAEWAAVQETLRYIYIKEKHSKKELAFIMSTLHDFDATEAAYNRRFSQWRGFAKNKTHEREPGNTFDDTEGDGERRHRDAQSLRKNQDSENDIDLLVSRMSLKERDERTKQELKRNARKKKTRQPRTRTGDVRKQKALEEYASRRRPTPSISAEPHFHQYKIFHAIDRLVRGLFDTNKRSRSSHDIVNKFVDPDDGELPGTLGNSAPWQLVEDKCINIVHLSEARIDGKVKAALEDFFKALKTATRSHNPNFLIHFWKICLALSNIRLHRRTYYGDFLFLRVFLQSLWRNFLKLNRARDNPFVTLIDSLLRVAESSPRDMKETLGLSYWKAIHVLADMPNSQPIIIQNMGLDCAKHWNGRFKIDPNVLESQEEHLSRCLEDLESTNTMQEISLLYDYTCAMSKDKYNSETLAYRVSRLLSLTVGICQTQAASHRLQFDLVTRSFAFALEIFTTHHLETWNNEGIQHLQQRDHVCRYLDEGIEILRTGDSECQIRAAHLSKRLGAWRKSYYQGAKILGTRQVHRARGEEHQREKRRTKEIMDQLPTSEIKVPKKSRPPPEDFSGRKNNRWRRLKQIRHDLFLAELASDAEKGVIARERGERA